MYRAMSTLSRISTIVTERELAIVPQDSRKCFEISPLIFDLGSTMGLQFLVLNISYFIGNEIHKKGGN